MLIGLRPWEFDRLTPYEFEAMWAGYEARQDEEWRRTAWLAHYVLATVMGKQAPTPDELLGHVTDGTTFDDEDGDEPSEPPPV